MYKFKDVLILPSGVPITSGDITVRDSATEVAVTVYEDDETTPISQPFSPDNEGNVVFKAPNGVYDILLNGAVERDEIVFFDPTETILTKKGSGTTGATLTDGATISIDLNDSNFFDLTLTGSHTLSNPTLITGQTKGTFMIHVTVDSTGGYTLTLDSNYTLQSGSLSALAADSIHELFCVVRGATQIDVDERVLS